MRRRWAKRRPKRANHRPLKAASSPRAQCTAGTGSVRAGRRRVLHRRGEGVELDHGLPPPQRAEVEEVRRRVPPLLRGHLVLHPQKRRHHQRAPHRRRHRRRVRQQVELVVELARAVVALATVHAWRVQQEALAVEHGAEVAADGAAARAPPRRRRDRADRPRHRSAPRLRPRVAPPPLAVESPVVDAVAGIGLAAAAVVAVAAVAPSSPSSPSSPASSMHSCRSMSGSSGASTRLARRLREVGGHVVEQQDERVLAGGQAARPPVEEVRPSKMSPSPTAAVRFASGLGPPSAAPATRRSGQRGDETAPAVELSTSEIEMRFCTWSRCGGSFAPSSYHAAFTKPGLTAMPLTAATSGASCCATKRPSASLSSATDSSRGSSRARGPPPTACPGRSRRARAPP